MYASDATLSLISKFCSGLKSNTGNLFKPFCKRVGESPATVFKKLPSLVLLATLGNDLPVAPSNLDASIHKLKLLTGKPERGASALGAGAA